MNKKIISTFLIVFLLVGFAYTIPRAHAISFLGISGVVEIVIDPGHIATTIGKWLADVGKWVVDSALKTALATLKKRLLDTLVDQIIVWIQGGGNPQFIQDPGQWFDDAIQAAAGDTVIALDRGSLCTQPLSFRLKFNLVQPVFSQRVSCTLDDIVENVQAFRNNFEDGSWIAYQETLKPHNNQWGVQLLVQDEFLNQISKKSEISRYEASVGGGFLGQKRCNRWEAREAHYLVSMGEVPVGLKTGSSDYYEESPDGIHYSGKVAQPSGSLWKCIQEETVTPGQTVGDSLAKAIGSDIDFIIGSDDLSVYVAAIVDAAINKIAKESIMGLAYLSRDREERTCEDLEPGSLVRRACENYESARDDVQSHSDKSLEASVGFNYLGQLGLIESSLNAVNGKNDQLITVLTDLVNCTEGAAEPEALLSEAENRRDIDINDALVELGAIKELDSDDASAETRLTILADLITDLNNTITPLLSQVNTDLTTCEGE